MIVIVNIYVDKITGEPTHVRLRDRGAMRLLNGYVFQPTPCQIP
jgi:hypothetical protein